MSQPHGVLAHLLEGRDELVREVQRLTTAIAELDAVIERVGGTGSLGAGPAAVPGPAEAVRNRTAEPTRSARRPAEPTARGARRPGSGRTRGAARRAGAGTTAARPAPKSIRVHVLEMLAAEERDFELAEIIDRIHGAGIAAHDDAVRSITIKLMKDGQVERVGRGLYRLAPGAQPVLPEPADAAAGDEPSPAAAEDAPSPTAGSVAPSLDLAQRWDQPAG